jgi:selenocysteine lyase/cysteine desulfurase
MLASQKHLFEIPDDIAYLNAAYMTPLMRPVVEAGVAGIATKVSPWRIHLEDFYELPDRARGAFARLLGARADDIAVVPAASYGLQVAAENVAVPEGAKIIVLGNQYPSNVYVWRELAARRGAELVTVARPADWDWTGAVLAAIDERVAVVSLPQCHWTDGTLVDLAAVGERCRDVGAALVLDLTQSLGAMPFDLARVRPAFVACATYKWLLGPYSLGFLYVDPEFQGGRPIEYSPFSRAHSNEPMEWFSGTLTYRDGYLPGARRFDVGERANFALLPMAITAIEQILDWGVEEIAASLGVLTEQIAARCRELQLIVPPAQRRAGHMIGVRFPGAFPAGLNRELEKHQVHVSCRADSMRVSPHLYNDAADIDRLFEAMHATL